MFENLRRCLAARPCRVCCIRAFKSRTCSACFSISRQDELGKRKLKAGVPLYGCPALRTRSQENLVKPPEITIPPHLPQSNPNIFAANLSQLPPANCYSKIRSQRWNRSACPRQNRADACRPTGPEGDHAGHLSGGSACRTGVSAAGVITPHRLTQSDEVKGEIKKLAKAEQP
jgi:hypothetical protein